MSERRELPRVPLLYYLAIFDRDTDELIGYIGDITPSGALVLSDSALEEGREYSLKLEHFSIYEGTRTFEMDGCCLRSSLDEDIGFFKNGFQFTRISREHKEEISILIDIYCLEPDDTAR